MAVYHAESLLFGSFTERPELSDPTIYSPSGIALFLAVDTGELFETSGSAWTPLGTLTSLPGVTSDAASGLTAIGGISVADGALAVDSTGVLRGSGGTASSLTIQQTDANQTGYLASLQDSTGAPKVLIARDGEIVTTDDVLAPTGAVKGATVAFYPTAGTGAPIAGVHAKGEMICDAAGNAFICTVDGTPGTWRQISYV